MRSDRSTYRVRGDRGRTADARARAILVIRIVGAVPEEGLGVHRGPVGGQGGVVRGGVGGHGGGGG